MPRFAGQNKKRIDPRYFLDETTDRDKETFDSKGYDKKTGAYGPTGAEKYNTASARDKKAKKVKNENMQDVHALADKFPNITDERLSYVVDVVRDYMASGFDSVNPLKQRPPRRQFEELIGDEREFADELVALNRAEFGVDAGGYSTGTAHSDPGGELEEY